MPGDLNTRFASAAAKLLPADGALLLLAVSGGADSLALWDLVASSGRWRTAIYHLDHGLRAEASADAVLVRQRADHYAARGGAPVELAIEAAELPVLARRWRCGLEAAGRRHRYARLTAVAREIGAAAVLTGHHRDDQAETVLLNLLRGAGPVGLAGIARKRSLPGGVALVRPLLDFDRVDLRAHLLAQGLEWNEDASNADQRLRRNFIRHRVLPTFASAFPGFAGDLAALAERQSVSLAADEAQVAQLWDAAVSADQVTLAGVLAVAPALRLLFWRRLSGFLGLGFDRPRLCELDRLARAAPGKRLELGDRLFLRRRHALTWEAARPRGTPLALELAGPGRYRRGGEQLELAVGDAPPEPRTPRGEVWIDADNLRWPLVWRLPRSGERWRALGCPGRQTVAKFLSGRGVPSRLRPLTAVVADGEGILWIPGHGVAERARLRPASVRALHGRLLRLSSVGAS